MHRLRHADRAEMHAQAGRVGHEARDLFAGDEVGRAGMPVEELEAAVDAVVVGDADQIHPARLGDAIDVVRRGVALARAQPVEVARVAGVIRVDVEIGFHRIASERLEKQEL